MKTKKKAILGIAMAMIFSLAFMQGLNQKSMKQHDQNLQQVGAGLVIVGAYSESKGVGVVSATLGGCIVGAVAESAPVWLSMGPVGWIIGGGTLL